MAEEVLQRNPYLFEDTFVSHAHIEAHPCADRLFFGCSRIIPRDPLLNENYTPQLSGEFSGEHRTTAMMVDSVQGSDSEVDHEERYEVLARIKRSINQ